MKRTNLVTLVFAFAGIGSLLLLLAPAASAAPTVPTDIQQPGTQPGQVGGFTSPDNCDNCHGNYYYTPPNNAPEPESSSGHRASTSRVSSIRSA